MSRIAWIVAIAGWWIAGAAAAAEDVVRLQLREPGLAANVFRPSIEARYPAVLLLGGSGGGFSSCAETLADLLARRGLVVMHLAYFGVEGLPADLERIPLEYLDNALTWLRLQPYVDPQRLGVAGGSKGGELALLYASMRPDLRAVAALVPSGIVFQSTARGFPDSSSWSYHGRELPFVRYGKVESPPNVAEYYRAGVRQATAQQLAAATIPVERIRGPILLLSAKADTLWPSSELAEGVVARLRGKAFGFAVEHVAYEDAGHLIGCEREDATKFGGTADGMRKALLDVPQRLVTFFERALAIPAAPR